MEQGKIRDTIFVGVHFFGFDWGCYTGVGKALPFKEAIKMKVGIYEDEEKVIVSNCKIIHNDSVDDYVLSHYTIWYFLKIKIANLFK